MLLSHDYYNNSQNFAIIFEFIGVENSVWNVTWTFLENFYEFFVENCVIALLIKETIETFCFLCNYAYSMTLLFFIGIWIKIGKVYLKIILYFWYVEQKNCKTFLKI